jgi:hypothetical protein
VRLTEVPLIAVRHTDQVLSGSSNEICKDIMLKRNGIILSSANGFPISRIEDQRHNTLRETSIITTMTED